MADQQLERAQSNVAQAEAIAEHQSETERPDDTEWDHLAVLLANIEDDLEGVRTQLAASHSEQETPTPKPETEQAAETGNSEGEHTEVSHPPSETMKPVHKRRGLLF